MKRLALLMTMGVFFSSGLLAQNFSISGGTSYSLALCANGQVISWGNNAQGQLGRTPDATNPNWKPSTVQLVDPVSKAPLTFSLIDAGSGGHAIARACDGSVYTWGGNEFGQLGNGVAVAGTGVVTKSTCTDIKGVDATGTTASICAKQVAQHVVAGATAGKPGFDGTLGDPYSGYLKNVVYVTSSTASSFAIVKDPITGITNLLAWGVNDEVGSLIWGRAAGALGIGSTDKACSYPRYVVDKNGKPLENIIAVDAGDINCYAIIGDSPTATSGTVYGWGNNANNNISPLTTANPRYAMPIYTDAAGTKPLTRVKMISAGDAFLLAYDEDKYLWSIGNEWMASGSGGTPRGNGQGQYMNPKFAAKVVAGEEFAYNGGSSFLEGVTGIAAGQSSAMAMVNLTVSGVTSNYVVSWGGAYGSEDPAKGTCTNDLGINSALNALTPTFAYRKSGSTLVKMDNVVAISDGDGVMYALRDEVQAGVKVKQLYVTGTNGFGQLGFDPASTSGTCIFTPLGLPNCDVADPCAKADLAPMTICPATIKNAYAGSDGVASYHYVWERYDSTGVFTTDGLPGWYDPSYGTPPDVSNVDPTKWTFDATTDKSTYPVDLDGYWKVSIYDNRKVSGCGGCPLTIDSAIVKFATTPIDTTVGKWCGTQTFQDTLTVIEPTYKLAAADKKFLVYGSDVSTKALATVDNAAFGTKAYAIIPPLNIADLESLGNDVYRYWVADSTTFGTSVMKSTTALSSVNDQNSFNAVAGKIPDVAHTLFLAFSDIKFKSFNLYYINKNQQAAGSVSITPIIYSAVSGSVSSAPGYIQSAIPVFTGKSQTFTAATAPSTGSTGTVVPITIDVSTILPGESTGRKAYFLSFKVDALSNNSYVQGESLIPSSVFPASDPLGLISIKNSTQLESSTNGIKVDPEGSTRPLPFNWVLQQTTAYECGRIPIRVKKDCPPCTEPYPTDKFGSFKITATGTGLKGIKDTAGYICDAASITLTAQALSATAAPTTEYTWVKGTPSASTSYTYTLAASATTPTTKSVSAAAATTADVREDWYLIARDSKNPTATMCYDTTHFAIVSHKKPTYTIIGGGSYCDYKSATAPDLTIKLYTGGADTVGKGPLTIKYSLGATKTTYTSTSAEKDIHTFSNLADGTYKIDSIGDKYCTVATTESIDIQKVALADTAWTAGLTWSVCESKPTQNWPLISVVAPAASATASYKYQWYFKSNGSANFATKGTLGTANSLQTDKQGLYYAEIQKTVTNKSFSAAGLATSADLTCKSTVDADTVVLYKQPSYKIEKYAKYCAGKPVTPIKLTITADTVLNGMYGPWTITPSIGAAKTIASVTSLASTTTNIDTLKGLYYATVKNTVTGCSYVGKATVTTDTATIVIQDAIKMSISKPADYCSGSGVAIDLSKLVTSSDAAFSAGVLTYSAVKTGGADAYSSTNTFAAQTVTTAGTDDVYDLKIKWQKPGESCAAIADTTITVYGLPTATLTPRKPNVCLGDTVSLLTKLTGSHIGTKSTHKWEYTPASNATISGSTVTGDATVKAAVLTPLKDGAIALTYTITDDNKCVGTATATVTGRDTPTVVIKAPKLAFCDYEDPAIFTVTTSPTGGTGVWSSSVPAAISATGSFDPKTSGLVKTSSGNKVKYAYTDTYGCKNADSVQVVINAAPTLAISNTKVDFCPYEAAAEIMFTPSIIVDATKFTTATGVSGGKFDPKAATKDAATKVEYTYTDATTKCSTVVSKNFTAWKQTKPTLSIPDTLCLDGTIIDLTTYASNYTNTQKLTPTSINTANTKGKVYVDYVYENAHACKDTAKDSTIVFKPATPLDSSFAESIKINASPWVKPVFPAKGIAATNTYKWFYKGTELTQFANTSLDVEQVSGLNMDVAAVHIFKLVQYRKGGCASDSATIRFELINCPYTKAPLMDSTISCYEVAAVNANARTIGATPQNTGSTIIHWFKTKTSEVGKQDAVGLTYEVPLTDISSTATTPQVISMYAFEYYENGAQKCYGGGQEVKLTVNPKPKIEVAIKSMCYNSSAQDITLTPSGGEMFINGVSQGKTNKLDPATLTISSTKATTTLNVAFAYTSESGCKADEVKQDIDIYYVAKPIANDTSISIAAIKNGAKAEVTARLGVGGVTLGWYENLVIGNTTPVSKVSPFDTKKNVISKYTYLVNNVDAHGCRSDSTKVVLNVIECPTPAPKFVKDTLHVCAGKPGVTLEVVQEKDAKNANFVNYKWYTSETGSARINTLDNLLKYTPATTATVDVWVSQEGSDGSAANSTCEGPRTKATVQVNPMPTPSIALSAKDICLTGNTSVELTGSPVAGGTGYYTHRNTAKNSFVRLQSNIYNSVYDTTGVAASVTYTDSVTYVFTTKFACTDSATDVVKTHHVARLPKIADASYMREKIAAEIKVTYTASQKDAGAVINWSGDKTATGDELSTGLNKTSAVKTYTYSATQSVTKGAATCVSLPRETTVKLFDCPVKTPTIIGPSSLCTYSSLPEYAPTSGGLEDGSATALGSVFNIYSKGSTLGSPTAISNPKKAINNNQDFKLPFVRDNNGQIVITGTSETFTFTVTEYDKVYECESPVPAVVTVKVNDVATPGAIESKFICAEKIAGGEKPTLQAMDLAQNQMYIYTTDPTNSGKRPSTNPTPDAKSTVATWVSDVAAVKGKTDYWITYFDNLTGCMSLPTTASITVYGTPSAPVLNNQNSCQYLALNSVKSADTTLSWYWLNADATTPDATGTDVLPVVTKDVAGDYTFWARKITKEGCRSDAGEAIYTVKPKPAKVTFIAKEAVCSKALPLTVTVNGTAVEAKRGTTSQSMMGINQYKATAQDFDGTGYALVSFTQTVDGCISDPNTLPTHLVTNPTTTFTTLGKYRTCENSSMTTMKVEGNPNSWTDVRWYLARNQTTGDVAQGQKYKPSPLSSNTSFYVHEVARYGNDFECHGDDSQIDYEIIPKPATPSIIKPSRTYFCSDDVATIAQVVLNATSNALDAQGALLPGTFVWKRDGITEQNVSTGSFPLHHIGGNQTTISVQFSVTTSGAACVSDPFSLDFKTATPPQISRIFDTKDSIGFTNRINVCQMDEVELKALVNAIDLTWKITDVTKTPNVDKEYYSDGGLPVVLNAATEGYVPGINYPLSLTAQRTYTTDVNMSSESTSCSDVEYGYLRIIKTPKVEIIGQTKTCESLIKDYRYTAKILEGHVDSLVWPDPKKIKWESVYDKTKDPLQQEIRVLWQEPKIDTITLRALDKSYGCYGETALPVQVARKPSVQFTYDIPGFSTKVRFLNQTTQDSVTGKQFDPLTEKFVPVSYPVYNKYYWDFGRDEDKGWVVYDYKTDSTQRVATKEGLQNLQKYEYGFKTVVMRAESDYGCSVKDSIEIFVDIKKGAFTPNAMCPSCIGESEDVRTFKIKGFNFRSYTVTVYDQWGNILWSSSKLQGGIPAEGWDGTYNGQYVKEDVYIWHLEGVTEDGREWDGPKYGNIVVLRKN